MSIFDWFKNSKKNESESIEHRLAALQPLGLGLNSGRTVAELLESWDREAFDQDPILLYLSLGGEVEVGPTQGERFCDRMWRFDTECVTGSGDYVEIINNLSRLTSGELSISNVIDSVDLDAPTAWVAFDVGNDRCHWEAVVDDDWADMSIITKFAALLESRSSERRIATVETGGQDCLLVCIRKGDLSKLRTISRLEWKWLS
jgi:hypothetical protein